MSHSKQLLVHGTRAHYDEADLYDHTYRRRTEDVRFYVDAARELGAKRVLELGVGSGRVAVALARAGVEVLGVDQMQPMLDALHRRLEREPSSVRERVTTRCADLRTLRLKDTFELVVAPFNVLMHLYERQDWERALSRIARHLKARGKLVFDVIHPDLRALVRDPGRFYRARPITDPTSGRRFEYAEAFHYDVETQVQVITTMLTAQDDAADIRLRPLAHRQIFPRELEALLHYNGFTLEHLWGDFRRGPLEPGSESQVVVARRSLKRERPR